MKLDETQQKKVAAWIEEGLKLSEIQKRLETELGLRMTYLDVRLLVDDLKLKPKDQPTAEAPKIEGGAKAPAPAEPAEENLPEEEMPEEEPMPQGGGVSVTVDRLTRPGALISGHVTFSDGKTAEWFLDQTGRLGVVPAEKGYKPPQSDLQSFQMALQNELQKLGF